MCLTISGLNAFNRLSTIKRFNENKNKNKYLRQPANINKTNEKTKQSQVYSRFLILTFVIKFL